MNYPLTTSGQVRASAAGVAEVADRYGRVAVISRAGGGTAALLDQTEQELSSRGIRCVRVQGSASGSLTLRGLVAQLTGQPDPGALTDNDLTDRDLKAGFMALTEPGQGYGRVALLVAEAHSLLPSAVRYIQLACQSSPTKLCLVLAGQSGLAAVLAGDEVAHLRGAMHVMELPEPAGQGLFDPVSAVPEPRAMPAASARGGSSSLVRLGLAALIVPIVGLIWWRHLPAAPVAAVPFQDAPSVPSVVADAPVAPPAAAPAIAAPAIAASTERAAEPAPSEPDPVAASQAAAGIPAANPLPPDTVPEPPVSEASAKPEAPPAAESNAAENTEQPDAVDPPDIAEQFAAAAEPPAAAAEPAAVAEPERSEPPQETSLAEAPAPNPATPAPAPDAVPPPPDPAVAVSPPILPPHGTLTVMGALPARGGARRALAPLAVPFGWPARAAEDRPGPADERRCRDIVLKAQLGKDPSDADKQFLRNGCRSG